jgi:hypothetical protein
MNAKQPPVVKRIFTVNVVKACLYITNLAAITMYIFVRVLFHDYNISFKEDLINFGKTMLIAAILGCICCCIYSTVLFIYGLLNGKRKKRFTPGAIEKKLPAASFVENMEIAC